jgi:hypothetical protein
MHPLRKAGYVEVRPRQHDCLVAKMAEQLHNIKAWLSIYPPSIHRHVCGCLSCMRGPRGSDASLSDPDR